jgi:O-antigen/teichoic acid export membrane protein
VSRSAVSSNELDAALGTGADAATVRWKYYARRAVQASFWSVLMRVALQATSTVRNLVLARLLAPDDFGLFGIALVVLSFIDRFSNSGLHSALIQKDRDIAEFLDTAWTVQAIRGTLAALTLTFAGPLVAGFFDEPRAAPLIQVLGLSVFLRGLVNPGILYFQRELEVNRQFMLRFGGTIVDLAVSIVAALVLRNVWALMIGLIAGLLTRLGASFVMHRFRPKPRLCLDQLRELSLYGRWVFLSNAVQFLMHKGDSLLIAKLMGAPALGIYMMARTVSELITSEVSRSLTDVAFPAYSRLQGDLVRTGRAFCTVLELLWSVVAPLTVMVAILAEPITRLLLGPKWLQAASLIPFLGVAGAVSVLVSNAATILRAVGRPSLAFRQSVINVVLTFSLMYPFGTTLGLRGVAIAVMIGLTASAVPALLSVRSLLNLRLGELARTLSPGLLLSLGVLGTVSWTRLSFSPTSGFGLAVALVASGAAYAIGCYLLWRTASTGPLRLLPLIRGAGRTRRESLTRSADGEEEIQNARIITV